MQKLSVVVITLLLLSLAVSAQKTGSAKKVEAALDGQVTAWNKGDLETAMSFYWNSPDMLWISKAGTSKGYQPVLEGYRKDFADRAKMGVYSYHPLHLEGMAKDVVLYVFRWRIDLDGKRVMGGISSQIWKKIKGRWVITAEHAS